MPGRSSIGCCRVRGRKESFIINAVDIPSPGSFQPGKESVRLAVTRYLDKPIAGIFQKECGYARFQDLVRTQDQDG